MDHSSQTFFTDNSWRAFGFDLCFEFLKIFSSFGGIFETFGLLGFLGSVRGEGRGFLIAGIHIVSSILVSGSFFDETGAFEKASGFGVRLNLLGHHLLFPIASSYFDGGSFSIEIFII